MKRAISLLSLALGLLVGGLLGTGTVNIHAQNATDCATPVDSGPVTSGQRLLGRSDYTQLPAAPARLTTTQITLAPGGSTQPFASTGPVLVIVQEGTVTLTADQARVGLPPEPSLGGIQVEGDTAPPAPADGVGVTKGEQISLEGGVSAKFGNDTSAPVRLLLVSLAPGEGATPTP